MRNYIAKALRDPCFHQRRVRAAKGRGSYQRKQKHAKKEQN